MDLQEDVDKDDYLSKEVSCSKTIAEGQFSTFIQLSDSLKMMSYHARQSIVLFQVQN